MPLDMPPANYDRVAIVRPDNRNQVPERLTPYRGGDRETPTPPPAPTSPPPASLASSINFDLRATVGREIGYPEGVGAVAQNSGQGYGGEAVGAASVSNEIELKELKRDVYKLIEKLQAMIEEGGHSSESLNLERKSVEEAVREIAGRSHALRVFVAKKVLPFLEMLKRKSYLIEMVEELEEIERKLDADEVHGRERRKLKGKKSYLAKLIIKLATSSKALVKFSKKKEHGSKKSPSRFRRNKEGQRMMRWLSFLEERVSTPGVRQNMDRVRGRARRLFEVEEVHDLLVYHHDRRNSKRATRARKEAPVFELSDDSILFEQYLRRIGYGIKNMDALRANPYWRPTIKADTMTFEDYKRMCANSEEEDEEDVDDYGCEDLMTPMEERDAVEAKYVRYIAEKADLIDLHARLNNHYYWEAMIWEDIVYEAEDRKENDMQQWLRAVELGEITTSENYRPVRCMVDAIRESVADSEAAAWSQLYNADVAKEIGRYYGELAAKAVQASIMSLVTATVDEIVS